MFSYPTFSFDNQPQRGRAFDLWLPDQPTKPYALYFIHGGGWRAGHREQMHAIMRGFYEQGYPCVSVCYRLSAGIPAQLGDVREGMALADSELRKRGFAGDFVLYGSSAGGHLALLAGLAAPGACGEPLPAGSPKVAGIIPSCAPTTFIPWEDIFPGIWSNMVDAARVPYEEAPEVYRTYSPETHLNPQSPPLLFLMGECEHMFPNSQTLAFAERARSMGIMAQAHIYSLAEHGFFYDLTRNAQRAAFRDSLAFLEGLPKVSLQ